MLMMMIRSFLGVGTTMTGRPYSPSTAAVMDLGLGSAPTATHSTPSKKGWGRGGTDYVFHQEAYPGDSL